MGLAIIIGVVMIALAIVVIMIWGIFGALARASRFLWHLLMEP